MDLGRYLLFTGRLTREEYQDLSLDQRLWGVQCLDRFPPDCLCPTHLDEVEDMSTVRELPFVEVLGRPQVADRVCARCGKTLEALVDECNEWHRDALEPISTYPTRSKFGRGVYERQQEKKLVAHYVVAGKKRDGSTLIGDGDTVILFEGSSALYIGLAIAAGHESVTVITPNAALIREYRDNPAVAQKFKLEIVGGAADVDPACGYCEHGGVYGPACQEQLTQAVTKEPPATVVVVTVAGLLPSVGPFDTGAVGCVKRDIITRALNSKVKAVIFATDYSKHIDGASGRFGAALFNPHEWKAMASNYESKIHVVTAPPPQIRAALAEGRLRAIQERPAGMAVTEQSGFAPEDVWYNHVAAELHKVLGSDVIRGECQPRFHEAYRVILNAAYYEKVRDVVESVVFGLHPRN